MGLNSGGYQSWLFWGPIPQVGTLKIAPVIVLLKPFASQEEVGSSGFQPNCISLCLEWDIGQERVSAFPTNFDVGIFFCPICRNHSVVYGFLSE